MNAVIVCMHQPLVLAASEMHDFMPLLQNASYTLFDKAQRMPCMYNALRVLSDDPGGLLHLCPCHTRVSVLSSLVE